MSENTNLSNRPSLSRPAPGTLSMPDLIRAAGNRVGLSEMEIEAMLRIAGPESGFNAKAKNPRGSARGLFQFISSTWRGMVGQYGGQYGFDDVMDPWDNALAGALFIRDNIRALKGEFPDREITFGDIYAAHFLGASDKGAFKLIREAQEHPDRSAVKTFGESIAAVNEGYFYHKDGSERTVEQLYNHLSKKMNETTVQKDTGKVEYQQAVHYEKAEKSDKGYPVYGDGWQNGDTPSDKVMKIQQALADKGCECNFNDKKFGKKGDGVDGKFGGATKLAIKKFQKENGIEPASGVLDEKTIEKLGLSEKFPKKAQEVENEAVPEVDCSDDAVQSVGNQLAKSGVKSFAAAVNTQLKASSDYDRYGKASEQYGTESTIAMLERVARECKKEGFTVSFGNISNNGGGKIDGHATHQKGLDIDIRPERKDDANSPTNWNDEASYSRENTRKLIEVIRKNCPEAVILFNDKVLLAEGHGLKPCPGHDNHLHVRFPG